VSVRARAQKPAVRALLAALFVCAFAGVPARADVPPTIAPSSATIAPSLVPSRLGAEGALSFGISFAGGEFGVPASVRRAVLRFPAGLGIEMPELRSCAPARLLSLGAHGCPAQSRLGGGAALAEAHLGSQTVTEKVALSVFLGPLGETQPKLEILAQGYTPFRERVVLHGTVISAKAPFGEELVLSIPAIPTLPLEPDASIVSLSITLGSSGPRVARDANTVLVPTSCPVGGFPFAAEFVYADGSSSSALASAPCP
jgi:hypothetical protein